MKWSGRFFKRLDSLSTCSVCRQLIRIDSMQVEEDDSVGTEGLLINQVGQGSSKLSWKLEIAGGQQRET